MLQDQVATLYDYKDLMTSVPGNTQMRGGVNFNEVDTAVALLDEGINWTQGYLPFRSLSAPSKTGKAQTNDKVFKVGRTTGLTHGEVKDVGTVVGPVSYTPGPCWFRNSVTIEGLNGTVFSDKGDSGSAVLKSNGEVIGLIYAGNGKQTYVCPIDAILSAFSCTLA